MKEFMFSSSSSRIQPTNQLLLRVFSIREYRIVPRQRFWFCTCHIQGRLELSTLEIEDQTPLSFFSYVVEKHGKIQQNLLICKSKQGRGPPPLSAAVKGSNTLKLRAMSRVSKPGPDGQLPATVNYLLDFGFAHDRIKDIVRRYPYFAHLSLDGKIKPFVEFLIELGVPTSGVLHIIFKQPQLCGVSLSQNVLLTMTYLESFGIIKSQWAKVIQRFPPLLTLRKEKIKASIDFFAEMGLSEEVIGKILTLYPSIVGLSVEEKLRPMAEYFKSLGISPSVLIRRVPQVFVLSIDGNLELTKNFFLDKGYSTDEVILMISRFGNLYNYSLANNIEPKWEFFLTMGYAKSELVKCPRYFSHSLERRIKPRFSRMVSYGVRVPLSTFLTMSDLNFEKLIQKRYQQRGDLE